MARRTRGKSMLKTCRPLTASLKTLYHLEKDRAQLTCFWETLNLSRANIVPEFMGKAEIPHKQRAGAENHVADL